MHVIAAHRTPWADTLAQTLMRAGLSPGAYLAAFVACLSFGWRFRAWGVATAALLSAVLSVSAAEGLKGLVGRPRPPGELALVQSNGYATPSSIAAMTLGAAAPLIIFGVRTATRAGRLLAALLVLAVLTIGVSMIYLGAHWVSDVLAGWAVGAALGALTLSTLRRSATLAAGTRRVQD